MQALTNLNSPTVAQNAFDRYLTILKVKDDEARRELLWQKLNPGS